MDSATATVKPRAGCEAAFAAWQSGFTRAISAAPGFVSLEIAPGAADAAEWRLTQRFRSAEALALWRASPARARLLAELAPMRDGTAPPDEADAEPPPPSWVTEVITTRVEPGREGEFHAWAAAVQARQAAFPGYGGTLVQAPLSPEAAHWTTLVRFATPAQLDGWLASRERRALLERADPLVSRFESRRLEGPFPGWFPAAPDRAPPPAWKQSMLVLLVLFPVVMLEMRFLSPLLAGLDGAVATFIGNALSVALTSWPLIQLAQRGLGWWLRPAPAGGMRTEVLGLGAVLGLYALEVGIFLRLS